MSNLVRFQNTLLKNVTTCYHNYLNLHLNDGEDTYLYPITTNGFKSIVPKIILDPHHPSFLSLAIWAKLKIKYKTRDRKYFQNFTVWERNDFRKDRAFLLDKLKETPKTQVFWTSSFLQPCVKNLTLKLDVVYLALFPILKLYSIKKKVLFCLDYCCRILSHWWIQKSPILTPITCISYHRKGFCDQCIFLNIINSNIGMSACLNLCKCIEILVPLIGHYTQNLPQKRNQGVFLHMHSSLPFARNSVQILSGYLDFALN